MRSYARKLKGLANGVPGITLLSDGRLFTYGHDKKYRLSNQDGTNVKILNLQVEDLKGTELQDGRLLCWSRHEIFIFHSDGDQLQKVVVSQPIENVFVLSSGCFFPMGDDQKDPVLYRGDGSPICCLSYGDYETEVCHAAEFPSGKFVTWMDCFAAHVMWNADGSYDKHLDGHSLELRNLTAISGDRMLSAAADNRTFVYDKYGNIDFEIETPHYVDSAIELPDGRFLLEAIDPAEDDVTWIYCSSEGEILKIIEDPGFHEKSFLKMGGGRFLSPSAVERGTLVIWKPDHEIIAELKGHMRYILGALELTDGRLVTWSADNTIRLWTSEGEPLGVLRGHTAEIQKVFELESGELLSSAKDGQLLIWES